MRNVGLLSLVTAIVLSEGCARSSEDEAQADVRQAEEGNSAEPGETAGGDSSELPQVDSAEAHKAGAAAFAKGMCSKCHGEDGTGSDRGPDLTDDIWQHCDGSVAGIRDVLVSGVSKEKVLDSSRPFGMNPATNLIKDSAALDALAKFVHNLPKN